VRELSLLIVIVVCGTGGELCVTRAMKEIGEVTNFRPHALLKFLFQALRVKWMWIGVTMMAIAFFALLATLSFENVSFVVPVTALSYAAGAIGAVLFLRERVTLQRWIGVLVVCAGVVIVVLSKH
jgi:drug/metabolite transporter (DMT)-like permease